VPSSRRRLRDVCRVRRSMSMEGCTSWRRGPVGRVTSEKRRAARAALMRVRRRFGFLFVLCSCAGLLAFCLASLLLRFPPSVWHLPCLCGASLSTCPPAAAAAQKPRKQRMRKYMCSVRTRSLLSGDSSLFTHRRRVGRPRRLPTIQLASDQLGSAELALFVVH
jgi:hypothetical protein